MSAILSQHEVEALIKGVTECEEDALDSFFQDLSTIDDLEETTMLSKAHAELKFNLERLIDLIEESKRTLKARKNLKAVHYRELMERTSNLSLLLSLEND